MIVYPDTTFYVALRLLSGPPGDALGLHHAWRYDQQGQQGKAPFHLIE